MSSLFKFFICKGPFEQFITIFCKIHQNNKFGWRVLTEDLFKSTSTIIEVCEIGNTCQLRITPILHLPYSLLPLYTVYLLCFQPIHYA